ncbi:MAG: carboxypeptidase-like regulatory domain-containing protein [Saprospiraceae bacterium]|nr:carboxypeptidase-like regulatory domain-containing protein [Saprospiraceae bacterium]
MKNYIILLVLIFSYAIPSLGQVEYITISGKITDSENAEPLPFASIGMENTSIGTISNNDGDFDFHIPSKYSTGYIVIEMLGYEPYRRQASFFSLTNQNSIVLEKSTTMLDEVVIVDSLTGGDILRIALARIEQNYPMEEYSMQGFYRDVKKVNDEYISLLEAALEIYDKDYLEPRNPLKLRERVGLKEVRKSLNYGYAYKKYFDQYNMLEELLLENNVKYRSFTTDPLFYDNLKRTTKTNIGTSTVYELNLVADMGYDLTLYVDDEDYGIHMIIFENGDGSVGLEEISRSGKRTERMIRTEKSIEFSKFQDRYYLKYLRVKTGFEWINNQNMEVEAKTELFQELLINEINILNPEWISSGDKMKRYGLQFQDMPYNKEFWDNYNVIKDTPLDKVIMKDLEKYGDLDSQFRNY